MRLKGCPAFVVGPCGLVGSRRPVGGCVGNSVGVVHVAIHRGAPPALSREVRASGPVHESTGRLNCCRRARLRLFEKSLGHVTETVGHDAETGGHAWPKYAGGFLLDQGRPSGTTWLASATRTVAQPLTPTRSVSSRTRRTRRPTRQRPHERGHRRSRVASGRLAGDSDKPHLDAVKQALRHRHRRRHARENSPFRSLRQGPHIGFSLVLDFGEDAPAWSGWCAPCPEMIFSARHRLDSATMAVTTKKMWTTASATSHRLFCNLEILNDKRSKAATITQACPVAWLPPQNGSPASGACAHKAFPGFLQALICSSHCPLIPF